MSHETIRLKNRYFGRKTGDGRIAVCRPTGKENPHRGEIDPFAIAYDRADALRIIGLDAANNARRA